MTVQVGPRLIRHGTRSRTVLRVVVLGSRLDHKPNTQYILPNSSGNAGSRVMRLLSRFSTNCELAWGVPIKTGLVTIPSVPMKPTSQGVLVAGSISAFGSAGDDIRHGQWSRRNHQPRMCRNEPPYRLRRTSAV